MIEILTENLAAGELKTFMVQGEYLEILEAQYPLDVFMMDRSGGQISTMRQAEASFFSRPGQFEVFQVQSANAQRVRLFVGSGDAGTRRTAGVVSVVDGEKARTLAGGMFVGGIALAGSAGVSPYAQLWNPAASGKNLIVQQLSLSGSLAGNVYVHWLTAALATDASAVGVHNKKQGLAVGVGQLRTELKGPGPANYFFTLAAAANQLVPWTPKGNIVIPPGAGLTVAYMSAASNLFLNAEWFEETI